MSILKFQDLFVVDDLSALLDIAPQASDLILADELSPGVDLYGVYASPTSIFDDQIRIISTPII